MAGVAVESLMPSVQLEFRPCVVVKVPELPVSNAVAVLALRAQPTPMHVVVLMAGVAGSGCLVLIETSGVTTLAGGCTMPAEERVFGISIVIESDRFPPDLVVTFLAVTSKVGPVNIVFFVAPIAFGRCLVFIERSSMTTVTFRLPVVPLEEVRSIPIMLK